jgi:hypothetical protein
MSEAEIADGIRPDPEPTVEDVRELVGPATPHFALQIRDSVRKLIEPLPPGHPVRVEGERSIEELTGLAQHSGEPRGVGPHD